MQAVIVWRRTVAAPVEAIVGVRATPQSFRQARRVRGLRPRHSLGRRGAIMLVGSH